jgi:hypothetical protein
MKGLPVSRGRGKDLPLGPMWSYVSNLRTNLARKTPAAAGALSVRVARGLHAPVCKQDFGL